MNKPTFRFEKTPVWRAFLQVIKTGIFVCAAVDIVVMFIAVVMRYIFHEDFFGYEEILMNVILWMYYLGAAYATYNETHIKGDVMSFVFKTGKQKKFYNLSMVIISIIIMAFWVVWGFQYASWNIHSGGTSSALHIPLWIGQISIYIGILGLFFFAILNLAKYIVMKPEDFVADEPTATATDVPEEEVNAS